MCRSAAPQVGLDGERRGGVEADAIHLHVLHHALHIVTGFREWNALDPVDPIDPWVARITELFDPLLHAPASGIISRERKNVVAAIVLNEAAELGGSEL